MKSTIIALPSTAESVTAELLRSGPTVGMPLGNKALGISRGHGYALAARGEYPVRVLRVGNTYRVVTSELVALLGLAP